MKCTTFADLTASLGAVDLFVSNEMKLYSVYENIECILKIKRCFKSHNTSAHELPCENERAQEREFDWQEPV